MIPYKSLYLPVLFPLVAMIAGCATIGRDYDEPKIDVIGIEKAASDTETLAFTLKLRITNPNANPIRLDGLYYEFDLEGLEVINGTARDLPDIEGYSNETISVGSAANMVNSIRLASLLMSTNKEHLNYTLRVKLGTSSRWVPASNVAKSGQLSIKSL